MIEISSNTNTHFRRWIDLNTSRGIKKHQEFILMGEKLVLEFLEKPNFKIRSEIICEGQKSLTSGKLAQPERTTVFKLSKNLFREVDTIGTGFNLLILEPKEILSHSEEKAQGLELICPLGDPANLGALARSALAFGASKIVLTEESCSPYLPKAIKASAGALLKMPLAKVGKFSEFISGRDDVYALDLKGENVARFPWPKDLFLAVGEEGPGFSGMQGLNKLSIPTQGVESLNATVAVSIALYEASKRLQNLA